MYQIRSQETGEYRREPSWGLDPTPEWGSREDATPYNDREDAEWMAEALGAGEWVEVVPA